MPVKLTFIQDMSDDKYPQFNERIELIFSNIADQDASQFASYLHRFMLAVGYLEPNICDAFRDIIDNYCDAELQVPDSEDIDENLPFS